MVKSRLINQHISFPKITDAQFEKTYEVQKDNRLIIKLPERFKSKKMVMVIIEDIDESRQEKIKLQKGCALGSAHYIGLGAVCAYLFLNQSYT